MPDLSELRHVSNVHGSKERLAVRTTSSACVGLQTRMVRPSSGGRLVDVDGALVSVHLREGVTCTTIDRTDPETYESACCSQMNERKIYAHRAVRALLLQTTKLNGRPSCAPTMLARLSIWSSPTTTPVSAESSTPTTKSKKGSRSLCADGEFGAMRSTWRPRFGGVEKS